MRKFMARCMAAFDNALDSVVERGLARQAIRDDLRDPRLRLLAETVERGVAEFTGRHEDVDSARAPGWYVSRCVCGWETSGREPVVKDATHDHVAEHHVRPKS